MHVKLGSCQTSAYQEVSVWVKISVFSQLRFQSLLTSVCGQENADYAFLMDASRSILPDEFQLLKNYVKDVIDYLSIGPALTHVGVIEYSKSAKMELAFDKSYDKEEIKRIVDKVPHTKGITRIDLALQVASQELFTAAIGGMRNSSRKVKCLLTLTRDCFYPLIADLSTSAACAFCVRGGLD